MEQLWEGHQIRPPAYVRRTSRIAQPSERSSQKSGIGEARVVFNVWNGVTNGTLVVPTFQEVTTIFFLTVPSTVGFEPRPVAW